MAFLHCHKCDFCQDDFWSENYNPITFLEKNYTNDLLTKDLDEEIRIDDCWLKENGHFKQITRRELLAWELEKLAKTIRGMIYRTYKEYRKKNKDGKCPKCGGELDID